MSGTNEKDSKLTDITITIKVYHKDQHGDMHSIDVVQGDELSKVLLQFILVMNNIQRKLADRELEAKRCPYCGENVDDIPF